MERFNGGCFGSIYCVGFRRGSELRDVFTNSLSPRFVVRRLSVCRKGPVGPRAALVMFSRIRRVPHTLASLGCFYRRTPRCTVYYTNSLLNVTLRRNASFPIKGASFLRLCPLAFGRFLLTGNRRVLISCVRRNGEGMGTFRPQLVSCLGECVVMKKVPTIIGR